MTNYKNIYDSMEPHRYYTAKELSVAGATMTAMCKRGMVDKKIGKPNTYCRIENNKLAKILEIVRQNDTEFFHLYQNGVELGKICMLKNGNIVDGFGHTIDIQSMDRLCIYREGHRTIEINLNK